MREDIIMVLIRAHPLERLMGMLYYATSLGGINGKARVYYEDFLVDEMLTPSVRVSQLAKTLSVNQAKRPGYALYLVVKRGVSTLEAASIMAKALGVRLKDVSFSGLKDSKALTYQLFSVSIPKGGHLMSYLRHGPVEFRLIGLSDKPIARGAHWGNHFTIVVRGVEPSACLRAYEVFMEALSLGGFPNFYGHQRFGTRRPVTHVIGKFLVLRRWEDAVRAFIGMPFKYESEPARAARAYFDETGDARGTLKLMPRELRYERMVLRRLVSKPDDYLGALKALPRRLLRLFVEAYQAYIFNLTISVRMERFGLTGLVDGDIVKSGSNYYRVRGRANLKRGEELMVTLVGCDVRLNRRREADSIILDLLDAEGVTTRHFNLKDIGLFRVTGGLRRATFKPHHMACAIVNDKRLRLVFSLERGSYATVVLREIMKCSPLKFT